MLLTTTSEKFAGIFGLPHLAPGADFFRSGQALLGLTARIQGNSYARHVLGLYSYTELKASRQVISVLSHPVITNS